MSDSMIRTWLDRAREYPTARGVQGWVADRDELIALLGECSPRVPVSVIPHDIDGDFVTFYVQTTISFARSELTEEPTETRETLDGLRAAARLTSCPNCDGVGKVRGAWDIEEDCPADGCADGRVTIAERDAILERLDGLQHRSRP